MVIPVYKPLGYSTHQLAATVGHFYKEPATHTGTLDPLAEGVVVILTGDDRHKRQQLASVDKEYSFEILAGFSTDSDDLLGLVQDVSQDQIEENDLTHSITDTIPQFVGSINQKVHPFSAKRVQGKSAFDRARDGEDMSLPTETVHISKLEYVKSHTISLTDLSETLAVRINSVQGDFRQQQILDMWSVSLRIAQQAGVEKYVVLSCSAVTGKRTYIRTLVRDIGTLIKIPLTTFSIIRTRNGHFTMNDCHRMQEYK
ncbi:hypothetical protein HGA91_06475 [candidate division WWE3 bacterium]|nr:hypothetical protein [candidate division WWE3 bacterium]